MGFYINNFANGTPLSNNFKDVDLLDIPGALIIPRPDAWQEDLVCVVKNGQWDAAAYCYSQEEFVRFNHPDDRRIKIWLHVPNAKSLTNYQPAKQ